LLVEGVSHSLVLFSADVVLVIGCAVEVLVVVVGSISGLGFDLVVYRYRR
jgi:hypothetical protein